MPGGRMRSKRRNWTAARPPCPAEATRLWDLAGQPRPMQRTDIRDPAGACTARSLSLTPCAARVVTMRTIGKGCISGATAVRTGIVCDTVLDRPAASETCRRTTWLPAVAKDVVMSGPPAWKELVPDRSQAKAVRGLVGSVEVETNETRSPVCGAAGTHVNAAVGGDGARAGAPAPERPVSVKVRGGLVATLPAWSDCAARTE